LFLFQSVRLIYSTYSDYSYREDDLPFVREKLYLKTADASSDMTVRMAITCGDDAVSQVRLSFFAGTKLVRR